MRGTDLMIGENHVFRFNNPEEVRKQRDRATAKSSLQLSLTAPDLEAEGISSPATRPDSPASSTDQVDVDWTFAKREAAFARLGLDPTLDNLPDDDLNKLFEKITKVKTMRDHRLGPRPESSLSQADDVWSESGRPISSDATTDDTSLDANGSPAIDGTLKDVQHQLESRLQAITESTEAEDLKVEKDHMQHQLKMVQAQMRRLIDARARGETDVDMVDFEPVIYSARQLRLIRKVLDRWRAHRAFSMAEVVLSSAVIIKEANIIRYAAEYHLSISLLTSIPARSCGRMCRTILPSLQEDHWLRQRQQSIPSPAWMNLVMLRTPSLHQLPSRQ